MNKNFKIIGNTKPETTRIVRSCGWLGQDDGLWGKYNSTLTREKKLKDVCKVISREGIFNEQCSCLKDACNRGTTHNIIFSLSFMLLVFWGTTLCLIL